MNRKEMSEVKKKKKYPRQSDQCLTKTMTTIKFLSDRSFFSRRGVIYLHYLLNQNNQICWSIFKNSSHYYCQKGL